VLLLRPRAILLCKTPLGSQELSIHNLRLQLSSYAIPRGSRADNPRDYRDRRLGKKRESAVSSGQLEVHFASDQVGDRDEIAQ
jgi:hypothetical protein